MREVPKPWMGWEVHLGLGTCTGGWLRGTRFPSFGEGSQAMGGLGGPPGVGNLYGRVASRDEVPKLRGGFPSDGWLGNPTWGWEPVRAGGFAGRGSQASGRVPKRWVAWEPHLGLGTWRNHRGRSDRLGTDHNSG